MKWLELGFLVLPYLVGIVSFLSSRNKTRKGWGKLAGKVLFMIWQSRKFMPQKLQRVVNYILYHGLPTFIDLANGAEDEFTRLADRQDKKIKPTDNRGYITKDGK